MTNASPARIGRLVVMLVALAMWAVPATALAQADDQVDNDQSGSGVVDQGQSGTGGGQGGDGGGNAGSDGGGSDDNDGGHGGSGDVAQQNAANVQNCNIVAGGDARCDQRAVINQSINQGGGGVGVRAAGRGGRVTVARRVRLARTGFDAWTFGLLGGASLAGGLGLLARRRRLN
jgi:LPXTG-motif cell wall-anchored protein